MLIDELGYRAPSRLETAALALRSDIGPSLVRLLMRPNFSLPASVLSADPLISYSGMVPMAPLGVASTLGPRLLRSPAWFLVSPTWTIEDDATVAMLRRRAVLHRLLHPRHRIVMMCNTEAEAELVRAQGEAAFVYNKAVNTSELVFRPLDGATLEFDAIYNAQLASWKRHELALGIGNCGFLFYRGIASTSESEAALRARHGKLAPGHVFINEVNEEGRPVRLPPEEVNRHLNRAAVGLCLSAEEGAMFACTEYLLAGLPVVSTPSRGGRDFHRDNDFYVEVEADPGAVAAAVAALRARNIPREAVRERALARMQAERARFVGLGNAILSESGAEPDFRGFWPLKRPVVMVWTRSRTARKRTVRRIVDDLTEEKTARR